MIGWTTAPGFRPELTPSWLTVACLLESQRPPDWHRPFRAAYLGTGAAVTAAVTAAVHPDADVWSWGLTPDAVLATRRLRDVAKLDNLTVHERPGLPADLGGEMLDLVVIDRVLDSCTDDLRSAVVSAIDDNLRPGGLLAIAFRTTVGWAEITPALAVMRRVAERQPGDATDRARVAVEVLRQLKTRGTRHLTDRPWVAVWLDEVLGLDPRTVASEYLALPLRPLSHATVDDLLSGVGCSYIGSARPGDELLTGVPAELADLVRSAASRRLQEAYRDIATRPMERIDMYHRGNAHLDDRQATAALSELELSDLTGQEDPPTIRVGDLGDTPDWTLLRTLLSTGEAYPSVIGRTASDLDARWTAIEGSWGAA